MTEKIKSDREKGINPKEKDIKKAIKYGTEVRKADYIAKDPQKYYDRRHGIEAGVKSTSAAAAVTLGLPIGVAAGIAAGSIATLITKKKYDKYYNKVFEQARNETIADLKKHKIIR